MSQLTKSFIILTIIIFAFSVGLTTLAQEEPDTDVAEDVALDEDVEPEDLDIKEPKLLPDSPLYFLKNWGRKIRLFFAFSTIAKAELRERFSNEKLLELQKVSRKTIRAEIIEKAIENYQQELDEMGKAVDKIKKKAQEDPDVDQFLDKFVQHQALHQRVLAKLERQVPTEVFPRIKENRERHLEKFGEVMTKFEDKEKIQARIENNLGEIEGSKYKNFKNLEILLELEEKVPEQAKEAIRRAQENTLKRLKGDLEKMSPEDQEKFKDYLDKIGGDEDTQAEILENLKSELKDKPALQEKLIEARERIMAKVKERAGERNCPLWTPPAPGFCQEGRIIIKKDPQTGCPGHPICVIPSEVEIPSKPEEPSVCITLWDPVCGKDGKTYSNTCFARLAGVEVDYKGECRAIECRTDADCPQLRCGAAGTINARCVGVKSQCVEGRCQTISIQEAPEIETPIKPTLPTGYKWYYNEELAFQIAYPKTWILKPMTKVLSGDAEDLQIKEEVGFKLEMPEEEIIIGNMVSFEDPGPRILPNAKIKVVITSDPKLYDIESFEKSGTEIVVNSRKGYKLISQIQILMEARQMVVFIVREKYYIIDCSTTTDLFSEYEPIFNTIINSFTVD